MMNTLQEEPGFDMPPLPNLCPVCDARLQLMDDSGRNDGMQPPWYCYYCDLCKWQTEWSRTAELADRVLERKLLEITQQEQAERDKKAKCKKQIATPPWDATPVASCLTRGVCSPSAPSATTTLSRQATAIPATVRLSTHGAKRRRHRRNVG